MMKYIAPGLAAAAIGAGIVLAPIASANTDPTVSTGTDSYSQYQSDYHITNSPAGQLDQSF
ncbi:MAG: hypothetical protein P4L86_29325 [Mycobacterium sp.]|nr:hypothetical protein [Mycobacterium sp.]